MLNLGIIFLGASRGHKLFHEGQQNPLRKSVAHSALPADQSWRRDLRNDDGRLDRLTEDDEEDGDREQVLRHGESLAAVESKNKEHWMKVTDS